MNTGLGSRETVTSKLGEDKTELTTQAMRRGPEGRDKAKGVIIASLALGAALAGLVALGGTAQRADAALADKIVFTSNRAAGVDNPTHDYEIFSMNPDGTGLKQLTFNRGDDFEPTLSPGGKRIAYTSIGAQGSNSDGDSEIYVVSALDGSGKKNLTNNDVGVGDYVPAFSPDGTKIAYSSEGVQDSNAEGDIEVYVMNASDGSGQTNLTDNGLDVTDDYPVFSPGGKRIAYYSEGAQNSNLGGDAEVYRMNALDGLGKKNLTENRADDGLRVGHGAA